jgi:hypothetical protein
VKVLSLPLRLLFVAFYVGANIVFNYYLGIIDYGGLPSSTGAWAIMVAGGTVAGMLALSVEIVLYRLRGPWPGNLFGFMLRAILMAACWLSLAYMLTAMLALFQEAPLPGATLISMLPSFVAAPVLWFYMLAPAGLFAPFLGLGTGSLMLYGTRHAERPIVVIAKRS